MTHPNGRRQVLVLRMQPRYVHETWVEPPLSARGRDASPRPVAPARCETPRPLQLTPGMCYCGLLWLVWER